MTYSPFRHIDSVLWKRGPVHLTLFLTRRCNARCPFCFYLSDKNIREADGELTLEEIERISVSAGKLLWLAFSGGEIFLRDDITEIAKVFYRNNRPAMILFPTNGLLPDVIAGKMEAILRSCGKSTIIVKLSLEGPENVHDAIRGVRGSFQRTMQTYAELSRLLKAYPNFELGVNTVFCSDNQGEMDALFGLVRGMKNIKTHTVSLIRGHVADQGLKNIDPEKYRETTEAMAESQRENKNCIYRFRGAGLKAAQDILQRHLIYETLIRKKRMIPCYAGKLNIVITESGDVFPCEDFSMKLGNMRENGYSVSQVLRTDTARRVLRSIQGEKCFCTHECFMMTNILFNPRMYPMLLKEYVRL